MSATPRDISGNDTVSDRAANQTLTGFPPGWRECHICRDGLDRKMTGTHYCAECGQHFCGENHGYPIGSDAGECFVCYCERQDLIQSLRLPR